MWRIGSETITFPSLELENQSLLSWRRRLYVKRLSEL